MLCSTSKLLASYSISISKYFAALCWIRYSYHSYIEKIAWCKILWWFFLSFSSLLDHFFCFFRQAWPHFYSSDCYPYILGCWALIAPALVTHFQHDYCFILLNVIVHVEIGTSPFQMTLQDVQTMLPQVVHSQVPPFESLMVQFYSHL
jgi:hypothetical protein